jgi:hypothetical protein
MLEQLLAEIRSGNTLEVNALASRLNCSPEMVRAMLEHLARIGLLQPFSTCSDGRCGGCSLSDACSGSHAVVSGFIAGSEKPTSNPPPSELSAQISPF